MINKIFKKVMNLGLKISRAFFELTCIFSTA